MPPGPSRTRTGLSAAEDALRLMNSTTITERTRGIEQFSDLVSNRSNLSPVKDSKWTTLFDQLFGSAEIEKSAFLKLNSAGKNSASTLNRLTSIVGLIRKCVSQFTSTFRHKTMKLVFRRAVDLLLAPSRRTLTDSIALDCIRILRDFLLYQPHMEHLEPSISAELMAVCFALIFDEKVPKGLALAHNDEFSIENLPKLDSSPHTQSRSITPRAVDSAQLLSIVLTSDPSICLGYSRSLLHNLQRVFCVFHQETSAHIHLLFALHIVLKELELNRAQDLCSVAVGLAKSLVELWHSKNVTLKEHAIICLTYLLPFLTRTIESGYTSDTENDLINRQELVRKIFVIATEKEQRGSLDYLCLDALRFQINMDPARKPCIGTATWLWTAVDLADSTLERNQVIAWTALMLGANALKCIDTMNNRNSTRGSHNSPKRHKLENTLESFFDGMQPGNSTVRLVHQLQLLALAIDLHWNNLSATTQSRVSRAILGLLPSDVPAVSDWVFLCIGGLSYCMSEPSTSEEMELGSSNLGTPDWNEAWFSALRKIGHPACSRSASYAAYSILETQRAPTHTIHTGIRNFFRDLVAHGPAFPYDSVCIFLIKCLSLISTNAQLSANKPAEIVLVWLSKVWPEVDRVASIATHLDKRSQGSRRPVPAGFDAELVSRMLLSISRLPDLPWFPSSTSLLPNCASAETCTYLGHTQFIRKSTFFTLRAKSESVPQSGYVLKLVDEICEPSSVLALDQNSSNVQPQISKLLSQSIVRLKLEINGLDENLDNYLSGASCLHVKMAINLVVVAILYETSREISGLIPDRPSLQAIEDAWNLINNFIRAQHWTPHERSILFISFEPMLLPCSASLNGDKLEEKVTPGNASGLSRKQRVSAHHVSLPPGSSSRFSPKHEKFLKKMWRLSPAIRAQLETFVDICEQLVQSLAREARVIPLNIATELKISGTQSAGTKIAFEEDDDGTFTDNPSAYSSQFNDQPSRNPARTGLGEVGYEKATHAVISACVRVLILAGGSLDNSSDHCAVNELPPIVSILTTCTGSNLIFVGTAVWECLSSEQITMTSEQVNQILKNLGDSYLATYTFTRNVAIRKLTIQMLRASLPYWAISDNSVEEEIGSTARELCQYFTTQIVHGNIRSWEVQHELDTFLDAYVQAAPVQDTWDSHARLTRSSEMDSNTIFPTDLLLQSLQHEDYRVRYGTVLYVSGMFEVLVPVQDSLVHYWRAALKHLSSTSTQLETKLTRSLCIVHILVANEELRPRAYHEILNTLRHPQDNFEDLVHFNIVLDRLEDAAQQLGLSDLAKLYERYAAHDAFERNSKNKTHGHLPEAIFGSRLEPARKLELYRMHLLATGPLCYLNGQDYEFQKCAELSGLKKEQALQLCFPYITGELIARVYAREESCEKSANSDAQIFPVLSNLVSQCRLESDILNLEIDRVIVHLMCSVHIGPEDLRSIATRLRDVPADGDHNTFQVLTSGLKNRRITEPALPFYPLARVFDAMRWVGKHHPVFVESAMAYSIISATFQWISRSPFINDHLRVIASLSTYFSMSRAAVSNSRPVLCLILQGLVSLMSDENIFQSIYSPVKWTIAKIFHHKNLDPEEDEYVIELVIQTVELFGRIGASSSATRPMKDLAQDFETWLSDLVVESASSGPVARQKFCRILLLYWPRKLSAQKSIWEGDRPLVTKCLAQPRCLRLIHYFSERGLPEDKQEAGSILYGLLLSAQRMNSSLSVNDCKTYLRLLSQNSGFINCPKLGQQIASQSGCVLLETTAMRTEGEIISQIMAIVISLLHCPNLAIVFKASEFIRRSVLYEELPDFNKEHCLVEKLLVQRTELISHHSFRRSYDTHHFVLPRNLRDFSDLDHLIHSFSLWTVAFLQLLVNSQLEKRPFYTQLAPLFSKDHDFATTILPRVLHACLLSEALTERPKLSTRDKVSLHFAFLLKSESVDKDVTAAVLNLVIYLRYHPRPGGDPLGHEKWLDISWLDLARNATRLKMPALGFLFLEVGRDHSLKMDLTCLENKVAQKVIEELFTNCPEPDAFYSLSPRDPVTFLLQRYQHERQWESAFAFHGAILEGGTLNSNVFSTGISSISTYLASCGLNKLACSIFQSRTLLENQRQSAQDTLTYELAWRASNWDLPVTKLNADASTRIYGTLMAYNTQRNSEIRTMIAEKCLLGQLNELFDTVIGRFEPCNKSIGAALALNDISTWIAVEPLDILEATNLEALSHLPASIDYDVFERVAIARRGFLQNALRQHIHDDPNPTSRSITSAQETELKINIKISQAARLSGHLQSALNVITPFHSLSDRVTSPVLLEAKEEFAQVLWAKGEQSLAISTLRAVQMAQKSSSLSAMQLACLGDWMATARLHSPDDIIALYFEKAIQMLDFDQHPEGLCKISFTYAKFADKQYRELTESGRIEKLAQSTQRLNSEINTTTPASRNDSTALKALSWKRRIFQEDKDKFSLLLESQKTYLSAALRMYLNTLIYGDRHDDVVFRFVSLWFDHHSDDQLNEMLLDLVTSVPTYKFVRVAQQLSARLRQDKPSKFQSVLIKLIINICLDHPWHVLFQILLLRRGIQSPHTTASPNPRSRRLSKAPTSSTQLSAVELSRANAADSVLREVSQGDRRKPGFQEFLTAHKAYQEWALVDVKKDPDFVNANRRATTIPSKYALASLKDLSVPISTVTLNIDKTCKYPAQAMTCISSYDPIFKIAGGLHAPKITNCRGTNGKIYPQLFKGGDDVRQDDIMEQVFDLVNEVLARDSECRKRYLKFKTYNVIPLSSDAGVIEFVDNTRSLLEVLLPMHVKYNEPLDWPFKHVQKHLLVPVSSPVQERIKKFKEVMAHVRPAMRFWFREMQKCPQKWYEMRLNFTRSTATTSIVGHILGLGDRHLSNILLDQTTGEMIQIDLGIAFDAGKLLPIPELVPFRLTADIVDGFGMAGTEGVFRRCCEQTLRVLRDNRSLIMTIIDVLKYDPLRSWVVTEEKIKEMQTGQNSSKAHGQSLRQNDTELQVSENASRALASVESKLSGDLSVETTVNQLIMEATSIENLGSIYHGWAACIYEDEIN